MYRPVSEYVYGNDLISRTDFDPSHSYLTWRPPSTIIRIVLGSTALLTDRNGHSLERYSYDAFGNHYKGAINRVNELGHIGKRYDLATASYDYGFQAGYVFEEE